MMDHPKLYGKVEHYKDFNEYIQLNAGREKALKKNNLIFLVQHNKVPYDALLI